MRLIYGIFTFVLFTSLATGCKLNEDKEWDMDLLAPVANAELTIGDLLKDSSITVNPDKSLTLVDVLHLADVDLGNMIKVPDTVEKTSVTLKTLQLGRRDMKRNITLGEVAKNAGFTGQLIIASHGSKMVVPPLNGLSSGDIDINAESFFETATFINGKMEIKMRNGFPIEVTDLSFELRNKGDQKVVVSDVISNLKPNETFTKIYPLANKTVEGKLVAKIKNMNSPGSNGQQVQIDTTNALEVTISAYDMQVFSAKAIFPAQNVVNDSVDIVYNLDGAAIKTMIIKTGSIEITAVHTLKENLNLRYLIPGATKNGQPLDIKRTVIAAPINDSSRLQETIPIDGYSVDLTGRNLDTFNTFFNILVANIDSTGKLQELSLADKIYLNYGLKRIIPEYLKGYLGKSTYKIGPETVSGESFGKVLSGDISLPDMKINLELQNGVGAPAEIIIKSLKATNSTTKRSKTITSPEIIGKKIKIEPALDNPFRPTITNVVLPGSEVKALLEILPDKFEYEMEVNVNPDGNTSNYNDFVYHDSKVSADINIEFPLAVGLNGLTLQDTFSVERQSINSETLGGVKNAVLHINMENGFPIDAQFQAYILDKNNKIVDSLFGSEIRMMAGKINASTNKVEIPTATKFLAEISENKWNKLQENGKLIIRSKLNTIPSGQALKIYSTYKLKVKIAAEVRYRNSI
ncbi:MAG: hypothetical protein EOP53_00535 [Sphingobacteriales bacterium]|nr:MAG: hypothetical protein EOP53_00535 [Sphingobacteriales bacterium]